MFSLKRSRSTFPPRERVESGPSATELVGVVYETQPCLVCSHGFGRDGIMRLTVYNADTGDRHYECETCDFTVALGLDYDQQRERALAYIDQLRQQGAPVISTAHSTLTVVSELSGRG